MFHHGTGCKFESYLGSHVAANVESFAATFLFLEKMSSLILFAIAPLRKRRLPLEGKLSAKLTDEVFCAARRTGTMNA